MSLVLDASVAANWLLVEESASDAVAALAWLRTSGGVVPPLWHYEVRNALLMAERRGRVPRGRVEERLDSLAELPLLIDQDADLQAAFNLASSTASPSTTPCTWNWR